MATIRGRVSGGIAVIAVTIALGGCSTDLVVSGSSVAIAAVQPFTSFNDKTAFGNTAANASIVAATNSGFSYYNDTPELVHDESFGTVEVVSEDPFAVRYTVNDGITWSDGVPIDGADLLLAWAANSGALTTPDFDPDAFVDLDTGQFTDFPAGTVYFDGASNSGLQHVSQQPVLGEDGRSITLTYDEYFADWELAFDIGLPAHVVVENALAVSPGDDETEADAAKRILVDAVTEDDASVLAPVSARWNSAFNLGNGPVDTSLFVGSGPYSITAVVPNESVTLTANPNYHGNREPHYETVVVTTIADPLVAVDALASGTVDVIEPSPSVDVAAALDRLDGVTVVSGSSGLFEHLDLQFSGGMNGAFDDPVVREAFLKTVPRKAIVDELVAPLQDDAEVRESLIIAPGRDGYEKAVAGNGSSAFARPDIAGAKRLLAKAGATSPIVCILFDPGNPRRVEEFAMIADSAKRAGFVVTDCSRPNWEEFLGVNGTYDAALFAWNERTDAVTSAAARLASNSTVSNFSHYSSATVDDLLTAAAAESKRSKQLALLAEIDGGLFDDAYGLPLYQFPAMTAYRSTIENVAPAPLEPGLLWNLWEWEPAEKQG